MMNLRSYSRVVQSVLLLGLSLLAAPLCFADQAEDRQAVREHNLQRLEAISAKDTDKLQALYADDAVFMVPNAPPASGAETIGDTWGDLLALPEFRMTHAIVRVEVAESGDLAMDYGTYNFSFDASAGRVEDSGKYVLVWRLIDGKWRIAADIFNSNGPQSE